MIVGRMRPYLFIALLLAVAVLCSQPAPREQVGPLPGGGFLLNSGWRSGPAGKQIPLDTFPMSTALSPDGHYLLVLNGGYNPPTISVLEAATGRETSRVPVADGWLGLTFSPKGDRVYVGGGSQRRGLRILFRQWRARTHPHLHRRARRTSARMQDFIGDVALTPDGRLIYAADLYHDSRGGDQSAIRHAHRPRQDRPPALSHPLPSRRQIVLRHQLDGRLRGPLRHRLRQPAGDRAAGPASHRHGLAAGQERSAPKAKTPWVARLFVAAANTNSVYTLGVSEGKELRLVETINIAMTPRQPPA